MTGLIVTILADAIVEQITVVIPRVDLTAHARQAVRRLEQRTTLQVSFKMVVLHSIGLSLGM